MPHDVFIFDLDGTISDPLDGITGSINFALEHFGFEPRDRFEIAKYVGPPLDKTFIELTADSGPALIQNLVAKYRECYSRIGFAENSIYEGIPEALAELNKAGVAMGICTSKRADFAEQILSRFGLRHYFQFVSGGDIGIEKWQQLGELRASRQIGSGSIMIGDRSVDIEAAYRNGLSAAGVLWGYGSRTELSEAWPQYLLSSPRELGSLVEAKLAFDSHASRESI